MTAITTSQLDELERKARAATSGPWVWNDMDQMETRDEAIRIIETDSGVYPPVGSDRDHIAANSPDVTLQLVAIARAALALDRATVLAVLSEELGEYGLHTGGSYGVELDYNDKYRLLETVADRIVTALRGTP